MINITSCDDEGNDAEIVMTNEMEMYKGLFLTFGHCDIFFQTKY